MSSKFSPGDRVRVAKPEYGTFDRIGTVTEPDEFWTFGPCVVLDGDEHAGAYLDDDLDRVANEGAEVEDDEPWPSEPFEAEPVPEILAEPVYVRPTDPAPIRALVTPDPPREEPPWPAPSEVLEESPDERPLPRKGVLTEAPFQDEPAPKAAPAKAVVAETADQRADREWELYQRGLKDGWSEAVRHVAYRARVEGGAPADPGTIAPDLNGLIAGILARIESAEARALSAEANLTRREARAPVAVHPEPERPQLSTQTFTTLIQAVSEIVIQERERARLQWQAKLEMAEARAEAERARRLAGESEMAELRRRAEPPQLPAILQEEALVEVLACAEEFISGARLNRALVLHALRETLSHLRQVSAYEALRAPARAPRPLALERG